MTNAELEGLGINIVGQEINHFRFAGYFILISECLDKVEDMLLKLISASYEVGLQITSRKTEFITNLVPKRNINAGAGNPSSDVLRWNEGFN